MYTIRYSMKIVLALSLAAVFFMRVSQTVNALNVGNENQLLAFPLAVILPSVLICVLLLMPSTTTREGMLMRIGTAIHLLLILGIPSLALYLALGFPFVFLVVELFETRFPKTLRKKLTGLVIA